MGVEQTEQQLIQKASMSSKVRLEHIAYTPMLFEFQLIYAHRMTKRCFYSGGAQWYND